MKKRSFRIYLILTLLWTAGIFLHSAMPAAASNAESGGVLAVVQMILPWITHGVLRKAAHFLEFAVLGILLTGTFHGARNFTLAKPMLFAVLTAMTDETIQSFTPGRNCALSDVWLDAAGALTGAGLWGVEFFLSHENGVYFSELSPRPHDTGMVTLAGTQNLNEFELHCRAVLGLPIPGIKQERIGASAVILSPIASQERRRYLLAYLRQAYHPRQSPYGCCIVLCPVGQRPRCAAR